MHPFSATKIKQWAAENHSVSYSIFDEVDVYGKKVSPLFKWLQAQDGCCEIEWNFDKFLVDWKGHVVKQQLSGDDPMDLIDDI